MVEPFESTFSRIRKSYKEFVKGIKDDTQGDQTIELQAVEQLKKISDSLTDIQDKATPVGDSLSTMIKSFNDAMKGLTLEATVQNLSQMQQQLVGLTNDVISRSGDITTALESIQGFDISNVVDSLGDFKRLLSGMSKIAQNEIGALVKVYQQITEQEQDEIAKITSEMDEETLSKISNSAFKVLTGISKKAA